METSIGAENWIGIAVWIVTGAVVALAMKVAVRLPHTTAGHTAVLVVLGIFGAVVGGMLGVGIAEFNSPFPRALSIGGMAGAVALSGFITWVYRWGIRNFT